MTTTLGLLSDTHGLLRPEALQALRALDDCVAWLHAGDVGNEQTLDALHSAAGHAGVELLTVRGNVDHGPWAVQLPMRVDREVAGLRVLMTHDQADLPPERKMAKSYDLVVFGHSHQPLIERLDGPGGRTCWKVNPGSCGPRRFTLPATVARVMVEELGSEGPAVQPELIELPT